MTGLRIPLGLLAISALAAAETAPRPNLVLALFDDLNTTAVGCYAQHPAASTPALDRLAARGVRFTNAQTSAPICGPSRACLVSGLQPWRSGYFGFDQQNNPWRKAPGLAKAITLPEAAKANGYHIYGCGKLWHNGHEEFRVFQWGENRFGPAPDFGPMGPRKVSETAAAQALAAGQTTHLEGFGAFGPLSAVPPGGWQPFARNPALRYAGEADRDPMPDERNAAWASELIRSGRLQEPFLLVVGFNRPHQPEIAPDPYFDRIPAQVALAEAKEGDEDDLAPELRPPRPALWTGVSNLKLWQRLDASNRHRYTRAYLACASFADAQLGAVIEALDTSAYAARTITIATSDHGWHLGEKGRSFKNTPWEETCRVPFIVAGAGVAVGATCAQPMALVDLYPSFADWGAWKTVPTLDGHSLAGLCRDPAAGAWTGGDAALTVIEPPWDKAHLPLAEQRKAMQNYSLRTRRWRYIRACRGGEELYDHDSDPHEWTNLAGDPRQAEVLAGLRRKLSALVGVERWPDPAEVPLPEGVAAAPGEHD